MRNRCWFIWFLNMPVGLCHRDVWRCENVCLWPKIYWDLLPKRLQNYFWPKMIGICWRSCKILLPWLSPHTGPWCKASNFVKKSDHNIYNFDNNLITLFIILTTIWSQNLKFLQQCDHNVYNFDNNIVAILFNFDSNLITIFIILTTIWSQYS